MTAKQIRKLEKMTVRELQAKFAEVLGEQTRSPNKVYLVRRIREAISAAAKMPSETPLETSEPSALAPDSGDPASDPEVLATATAAVHDSEDAISPVEPPGTTRLSKLDVPTLQALYRETIGRETRSHSHRYLVYKLQEARKGRVPFGPRTRKQDRVCEIRVLPLRMGAREVEILDETWRRRGLPWRGPVHGAWREGEPG